MLTSAAPVAATSAAAAPPPGSGSADASLARNPSRGISGYIVSSWRCGLALWTRPPYGPGGSAAGGALSGPGRVQVVVAQRAGHGQGFGARGLRIPEDATGQPHDDFGPHHGMPGTAA